MIRALLTRLRGDTARIDRTAVLRATLADRIEADCLKRRQGREERQRAARAREAAKVSEQRARDPLARGVR